MGLDAGTAGKGNGEPRGLFRGVGHQGGCGRPLDLFVTLRSFWRGEGGGGAGTAPSFTSPLWDGGGRPRRSRYF